MIVIAPPDPAWPQWFAAEAARLRAAFGATALAIDHVGSTAVPGLAAKPVIDIQVAVAALAPLAPHAAVLQGLGYVQVPLGDFDAVYPFFVQPPAWPHRHHVHLCTAGGVQQWRHLAFRDALRADAALAADYLALKRRLAARHRGATHAQRERYSLGKSDFVEAVLAGAPGRPGGVLP